MIDPLTIFRENNGLMTQPSPPWGRGWRALTFSPAGAGRVRGSQEASAIFMAARNLALCSVQSEIPRCALSKNISEKGCK
jgi:hypothetical protein